MKACTSCSKNIPDAALTCVYCGKKQGEDAADDEAPKKTVLGYQAVNEETLKALGADPAAVRAVLSGAPVTTRPAAAAGGGPAPAKPRSVDDAWRLTPTPFPAVSPAAVDPAQAQTMYAAPGSAPAASGSNQTIASGPPSFDSPASGAGAAAPNPGIHSAATFAADFGSPQANPAYGAGQAQGAPGYSPYGAPPAAAWPKATPSILAGPSTDGTRGGAAMRAAAMVMGALLFVAFGLSFGGSGASTLLRVSMATAGAALLAFSFFPVPASLRAVAGATVGLGGIVVSVLAADSFAWQPLSQDLGLALLVAGALLTVRAPRMPLGRVLTAMGAVLVVLPIVLPSGGSVPVAQVFQAFGDAPRAAISLLLPPLVAILGVVMAFVAPSTGEVAGWAIGWILPVATVLGAGGDLGFLALALAGTAFVAAAGFGVARLMIRA